MEYESLAEFQERAGYTIDGVWYPRVTSIVSIKAKPALYRYYGGMRSFKAADDAKEASAREGTMVHEAVEAILRGTHEAVPSVIEPSVDAFREFLRNNHVEPLMIEERVVSRTHRYAGTIDALARINGVVGVLDIKTSKAVYRDYTMQTAAYLSALTEIPNVERPTTSWVLRLDQCRTCQLCGVSLRTKGGMFRVSAGGKGCTHQWGPMEGRFEFSELGAHPHDLQAFLAAKTLWEWEHRDWLSQLI
ncbi:MAG: hypothetical protein IT405_02135 [Candidatus Yanofskybacteria bacterium]|nr:hypothetical protein [Candidatus Yanofskybacteria bacterium]